MPDPTRILFIGNSFTNRNDLPALLARLAASARPARAVESSRVIANGAALKTHWERGEARGAIRQTPWDFVVLQEQSTLPLKNRQRMHESIRLFHADVAARGARTVLYLTWARADVFDRQAELSDAYASIGRELSAIVVPVGVAWQNAFAEDKTLVLHDRDKSHPNFLGSYLAACVFYATLFGKSPVGLSTEAPAGVKADADRLRMLQDVARRTVAEFGA